MEVKNNLTADFVVIIVASRNKDEIARNCIHVVIY